VAEIHDLNTTDASNTGRFPENMAPSAVNNGARALEGLIARFYTDLVTAPVATLSGSAIQFTSSRTSLTLTGTTSKDGTNNYFRLLFGGRVGITNLIDGTDGNLLTWNASGNPAFVTTGSANQVLTSNGAGAAPSFKDSAVIGQQTIWVPAAAMEPAVTTAAASSNAVEIGTSLFAARTMDFATGADDFAYFGIQMPKSWDAGTLVCQFVWSATGTTANTVLWAIAATSLGNDEVLTTAFPTPASPAADTNSTTADDIMVSAEVTVTVGSTPTAEDYVIFEVSRDVSGDTLAEDARLHGIKIHYTIDAGTDD
jgi:hypothetical protein